MMNDSSEIEFGLRAIRKHVQQNDSEARDESTLDNVFNPGRVWQFASSFSHSRDQLGQWRAYGTRVAVAVGFDLNHLESSAMAFDGEIHEVVYPVGDDLSAVADDLSSVANGLRAIRGIKNQGELISQSEEISRLAVRLASFVKHPSFAEEREVRMLFAHNSARPVEFRSSPGSLVPYVRVPIDGRKFTPPKSEEVRQSLRDGRGSRLAE